MLAFDGKASLALALWFLFNAMTLIINKLLFVKYQLFFPILLTGVHMFFCSLLSYLTLKTGMMPATRMEGGYRFAFMLSLLFVVNILLGTWSLQYIPVSFMQAVKSSVPAFNVLLQVVVYDVTMSQKVYLSMIPIVGGVALASAAEINFDMFGFILAVISSLTTALQTCLFAKHLAIKPDPINLLINLAPLAFFELMVAFAGVEQSAFEKYWYASGSDELLAVLCVSGVIAFLLNWSTFFAIQATSPLTYNVAGNFKAVINIAVSALIFKNEISFLNAVGCVIALAGMYWFSMLEKPPFPPRPAATSTSPSSSLFSATPLTALALSSSTSSSNSSHLTAAAAAKDKLEASGAALPLLNGSEDSNDDDR